MNRFQCDAFCIRAVNSDLKIRDRMCQGKTDPRRVRLWIKIVPPYFFDILGIKRV